MKNRFEDFNEEELDILMNIFLEANVGLFESGEYGEPELKIANDLYNELLSKHLDVCV